MPLEKRGTPEEVPEDSVIRMSMLEKLCDAKNTFEGKALAVFMSLVMVLSFINFSSFADAAENGTSPDTPEALADDPSSESAETPAPESAPSAEPEAAAPAETPEASEPPAQSEATVPPASEPEPDLPTAEPGVAVVGLDFVHAYITYAGQDIALPAKSFNFPLNKELAFTASADTGYEVSTVKAVVNGRETELAADGQTGEYKVPADQVTSNLVLKVEGKAVEAASTAPEDPAANPLTSDTKIEVDTAEKIEADVSNPAFEAYAQAGSVLVKVTAAEGVLPAGTSVQAMKIERQDVLEAVAEKVENQGKELEDAVVIDVTLLDKEGNAIQPSDAVNVCFFDTNVQGDEVGVFRVSDDASIVETINARQAEPAVQSFDVDHFTIYVISGSTNNSNVDGTMNGQNNRYEMTVGTSLTLRTFSGSSGHKWMVSSGGDVATIESSNGRSAVIKANKTGKATITHKASGGVNESYYLEVVRKIDTPTIEFDLNGGEGTLPEKITAAEGSMVSMPTETPSKTGQLFVGWSVDKYAANAGQNHYTSRVYASGESYTVPASNVKLYAVWTKAAPRNANFYIRLDGTIPSEPSGYKPSGYSSRIYVQGAIKVGKFVADPTGVAVSNNLIKYPSDEQIKGVYPSFNPSTQYVVWYAMKYEGGHENDAWNVDGVVLNKEQITLYYNQNTPSGAGFVLGNFPLGSQFFMGASVTVDAGISFSLPGYEFAGWNTKADGTGVPYAGSTGFTINETTTLYAQWIPNNSTEYKIEYFSRKLIIAIQPKLIRRFLATVQRGLR